MQKPLLLLALAGLPLLLAPRTSSAADGVVSLENVSFDDDGTTLTIHAQVSNATPQRIFFYASERRFLFEEKTRTLTVVMHSVPTAPTGSSGDCHVSAPRFRAVDAAATQQLDLPVPRHLHWLHDGKPTTVSGVPDHVRVELGWSDSPLTLGPEDASLCNFEADTKLKALERGVLVQSSP